MENLVKKSIGGDRGAQRELYNKLAPLVLTICKRYSNNEYDAQDVFQEAFIKVFDKMHQWDSAKGQFSAWVGKIAVNTSLAQFNEKSRKESLDVEEEELEFRESGVLNDLAYDDLLNLVEGLPFRQKVVFNLYVLEGYTHREIAEKLEIEEGTSRSQLIKARWFLQEAYSLQHK